MESYFAYAHPLGLVQFSKKAISFLGKAHDGLLNFSEMLLAPGAIAETTIQFQGEFQEQDKPEAPRRLCQFGEIGIE